LVDICIWVLLDSRSSSWRLLVYFVTTFFSLYLNCCYLCDQIHSPLKCMLDVLSLHRITLAYLVYFMYTIYIRSRESIENRKKKKSLQWFVLCAFSATKENRLFNSVWEPWCPVSGVLNSINYDFYDFTWPSINGFFSCIYVCMCVLYHIFGTSPLYKLVCALDSILIRQLRARNIYIHTYVCMCRAGTIVRVCICVSNHSLHHNDNIVDVIFARFLRKLLILCSKRNVP